MTLFTMTKVDLTTQTWNLSNVLHHQNSQHFSILPVETHTVCPKRKILMIEFFEVQQLWALFGNFGHFWMLWTLLGTLGTFGHSGHFWALWALWALLGTLGTFGHSGHFGHFWDWGHFWAEIFLEAFNPPGPHL